jgi:hypothetical protein
LASGSQLGRAKMSVRGARAGFASSRLFE